MAIKKFVTKKGLEKQVNCLLNGDNYGIKYIAVGDGNGSIPNPTEDDTKLVNEVWRGEVAELIDEAPKYTAIAYIPESVGDFIIREIGLFDENNELLFVSQMDETPKKSSDSGLVKQIGLKLIFELQNGLNAIIVDPSTVTASKDYVSGNYQKLIEKAQPNGYASLDETGKVPEAQLPNLGGGLEVCDIGMSLYIDETKGLRRWLNGQIVAINANTQGFLTRLKQIVTLHPSLVTTEESWQAAKTLSAFGQVGKFVFNYAEDGTTVESVRLPAVVNVQGLLDLQNLGLTVPAGLPNITGVSGVYIGNVPPSGAFSARSTVAGFAQTSANNITYVDCDASDSNPTYGASDTVQQEAIQFPYFIQIATGQETEVNITNEIELNNPFTLFDSKYSPDSLYNASWLKSDGEYKPKATYVTAYEALVVENNSAIEAGTSVQLPSGTTYVKRGLSVKLSTAEDISDYDFVINTTDETFRLPLKNGTEGMFGGGAVVGNGVAVTYTLYYYVGETVQNANLIDAGRMQEQITNINAPSRGYLVESYVNNKSWYRIYSDGWCEQGGQITVTQAATNITLLKSYKDNNYNAVGCQADLNSAGFHTINVSQYNAAQIQIRQNVVGSPLVNWIAMGYIK